MTRKELVKLGSNKVRKNSKLTAKYVNYLKEDAAYIYKSGRIPEGCFGCQFSSHFAKWSRYVNSLDQEMANKKEVTMANKKEVTVSNKKEVSNTSTYKLKDSKTKIFFKGSVLKNGSDDKLWIDFIKHNKDREKARKELFEVLPKDLQPKKASKSKEVKPKEEVTTKEDEQK